METSDSGGPEHEASLGSKRPCLLNRCAPVRSGLLPLPSECGSPHSALRGPKSGLPTALKRMPQILIWFTGRYNGAAGCWLRPCPSSSDTRRFCGLGGLSTCFLSWFHLWAVAPDEPSLTPQSTLCTLTVPSASSLSLSFPAHVSICGDSFAYLFNAYISSQVGDLSEDNSVSFTIVCPEPGSQRRTITIE